MDTTLFLEQFGHLAGSPGGVGKLRNLILDLAVRGKLVEQNPDDEPAIQVFNRLGLNKLKPQDSVENIDELKELPKGWVWKQIDSIAEVKGGKRIPKGHSLLDTPTPYIYIRVTDMKNGSISREGLKYISAETRRTIEKYTISNKDLYITIAGTIGSVGFVPSEFDGMNLTENAAKITLRSRDLIDNVYMYHVLNSQILQSQFQDKFNQMAQPKLSLRSIRGSLISLPPLAEQQRIVSRVDELMQLCDQLEAEQAERDHLRERAAKSTLFHLTSAPSKAEAHHYWGYAEHHFPELFDRVSTVQELRATILQLAVQGRLVPQNPDDEPAGELLKRIEAEKQRLVEAGEIKPSKPLPPIREDEMPYELPSGWEWIRLGLVSTFLGGFAYESGAFIKHSNNQVIRLGNVKDHGLILTRNPVFISDEYAEETLKYNLIQGDILITMTGTKAKKDYLFTTIVKGSHLQSTNLFLNQRVGCLRPIVFFNKFLVLALKSEALRESLYVQATGTANQANIGSTQILNAPLPLPPLTEQQSIVTIVDELMQLCDQLEAEAEDRRALSGRLFDSVVHHMFAAEG